MTLRAAVIGVGAMGRHHARVYRENGLTELCAVADPDEANSGFVAERHGVPAYWDHRAMLEAVRPDVVSVAVPTAAHLTVVRDCLAAGANVLVEKPMAASPAEGREMIALARSARRVLMVGHVERFNPAIIELRRRLQEGALGRVFEIRSRRMGPFPARIRDVGVVIDLAAHDLDIMRWLVGGEVIRVYAETARRIHTEHEDLFSGLLRFAGGEIGALSINWLTPTKVRELSVTGERGMFVADYLRQELDFYENTAADSHWETFGVLQGVGEGNMTRLRVERIEPLAAEIASFARSVLDGSPPEVTGEDGLATLALARAMVESGESGEVRVPEPANAPGGETGPAGSD